jgi:DNA-binding GntR family transcriptional regulator
MKLANHRELVELLRSGHIQAATEQLERRINSARDRVLRSLLD